MKGGMVCMWRTGLQGGQTGSGTSHDQCTALVVPLEWVPDGGRFGALFQLAPACLSSPPATQLLPSCP